MQYKFAADGEKRLADYDFFDSFITVRLAIARAFARWLPRCPFCHQVHRDRVVNLLPANDE